MNEVAHELVRVATRQFGAAAFSVEPNDHDPQADPGSVVLSFAHPRLVGHRADVIHHGNTLEVAYTDGQPPGPAEALFVFAEVSERADAIEDMVKFLSRLFTGQVVAYRERIGPLAAWVRADQCQSVLHFGTRDDIASRGGQTIETVYNWQGG